MHCKKSLFVVSIFIFTQLSFVNAQLTPETQAVISKEIAKQDFRLRLNSMFHNQYFYKNGSVDEMPYTNFIFRVTMKDSSEKEVWSRVFYDKILKQSYIEWVNKKLAKKDSNRIVRINSTDVLSVQGFEYPPPSRYIEGVITDSCWLFKILDGKLEVYSKYPETVNNITVSAIKETGGELDPFDPEKLRLILAGNEKALRRFEKKDYMGAIRKFNSAD